MAYSLNDVEFQPDSLEAQGPFQSRGGTQAKHSDRGGPRRTGSAAVRVPLLRRRAFAVAGPAFPVAGLALVGLVLGELDDLHLDRRVLPPSGAELVEEDPELVVVEPPHRQHRASLREADTANDHGVARETAHAIRARAQPDRGLAAQTEARLAQLDVIRGAARGEDDEIVVVQVTEIPRERYGEAIARRRRRPPRGLIGRPPRAGASGESQRRGRQRDASDQRSIGHDDLSGRAGSGYTLPKSRPKRHAAPQGARARCVSARSERARAPSEPTRPSGSPSCESRIQQRQRDA